MRIAISRFLPLALVLSASLMLAGCGSGPSEQAQLQKAREYVSAGKNRAALVELRNLVKKHPENRQGRLALGTLLLNVGDPAAAAVQLQRAQKLGVHPENVELPLARALLQTGKFKEALAELHPEQVTSTKLQAAMLTARGEAQIGLKQLQEADKSFAAALEKDPRFARAVAGQATLALIDKRPKAAIATADKALALDAKNGQALAIKGIALFDEKLYTKSAENLQQALSVGTPQLAPGQLFMLRARLVEAQIATGQRTQAHKNLALMLKQSPKEPYANYLSGLLAFEEKDYPTAVQHLQTALNANPYDARSLTLIGVAEAAQNHDVLATNYLSSALAQASDNPMARRLLASIQMRSGHGQTALDTLFAQKGGVSTNEILSLFSSPTQAIQTLTTLQSKVQNEQYRAAIDLALAQAFLIQGDSKKALSTLSTLKGNSNTAMDTQRLTAAAFIRNGEPGKAIKIAESIAAEHGRDVNVLHLASAIMLAAGSNKGAETMLRKAEKIAPDNPATSNALGALMLRENRLAEAHGAFENTLRHAPGNLPAQLALARIAAQRGQADKVTQWLDKASSSHPQTLAPLVILTEFQLRQQETKQAVETAQRAVKLAPKAAAILSLLGRAQLADKQNKAGLETIKAAAAAAPNDPRYALTVASAQLALQKPKEAQTTLTNIVAKHPKFVPAVRALAMLELDNKDPEAAFKTADKLATRTTEKAAAEEIKGDLYTQQKHYGEARTAYMQALKLSPSRTLAIKAFATGLRSGSDKALEPLLAWLQQHPRDVTARSTLANYYQNVGKLQDAETQYRLALKDSPDNPIVLNNLAFIVGEKSVDQALPLAEKAYHLAPKSPQIMDTYGWLLIRQHHPEKALPLLQQAAAAQKDSPQIQYHYAKALADTGQKAKAATLLTDILGKNKEFEDKAAAVTLLKHLQNGT
jgi:cellulose synthase operon protein C